MSTRVKEGEIPVFKKIIAKIAAFKDKFPFISSVYSIALRTLGYGAIAGLVSLYAPAAAGTAFAIAGAVAVIDAFFQGVGTGSIAGLSTNFMAAALQAEIEGLEDVTK